MRLSDVRISPAWLKDPDIERLLTVLEKEGARCMFVGGCVRDAVVDRPSKDIDLAIDQVPERVLKLLSDGSMRSIPTGLSHGTITALSGDKVIEVTTLRRDVETDGRRATVSFTDDWVEDAERRDFTFNALYCDREGHVYDPCDGLPDLQEGRVRFIGNAADRIEEDALRILRFFRFYAWYGQGNMDAQGLAACADGREKLLALSGERVNAEMMRLLAATDPAPVVAQMQESLILQVLIPCTGSADYLASLVALEAKLEDPDPLRRFFSLLDSNVETVGEIATSWRFSNIDKARLVMMARNKEMRLAGCGQSEIEKHIYLMGRQAFVDAAFLASVRYGEDNLQHIEYANKWDAPVFPVSGTDVLAHDIESGRQIGHLLRQLEDWWVDNNFEPGRDELLKKLSADVELGSALDQ